MLLTFLLLALAAAIAGAILLRPLPRRPGTRTRSMSRSAWRKWAWGCRITA